MLFGVAAPAAAQVATEAFPEGPIVLEEGETGLVATPVDDPGPLPIDVPSFYLSRVDVAGQVRGERAELSLEVDINLTVADEWQTVALGLAEASVTASTHTAAMPGALAVPDIARDRMEGLAWRLRGRGRHTLTLQLQVPIRESVGGSRQLALTLPWLPSDLYEATLRLTVPEAPIEVRAPDLVAIRTTAVPVSLAGDATTAPDDRSEGESRIVDGTEIVAGVPTQRLLVSWARPASAETRRIAESTSTMELRVAPSGETLLLDAEQVLTATFPEALERFVVELPVGFRLVEVTSPDAPQLMSVLETTATATLVRFSLPVATERTLRLRWQLAREMDEQAEELDVTLTGLHLPGPIAQTGRLVLFPSDDYSYRIDRSSVRGARLVDVAEGRRELAIETQPVRVPLTLVRQRPYFATGQTVQLHAAADAVELLSEVRVDVESGRLTDLPIDWAGEAAGWQPLRLVSATAAARLPLRDGGSLPLAEGTLARRGGELLFTPTRPQTGEFRFLLQTRRPLISGVATQVPLPLIPARATRPPLIELTADDEVEADLTTTDESRIEERPPLVSRTEAELPDLVTTRGTDRPPRTFAALTDTVQLQLSTSVHARSIEVESVVEVERLPELLEDTRLAVRQTLQFDASYGRLERIRLEVPPLLREAAAAGRLLDLAPLSVDGVLVERDDVSLTGDALVSIELPERRTSVQVDVGPFWTARLEEATAAPEVVVPLFRPAEAPLSSLRCRLVDGVATGLSIATSPEAATNNAGPSQTDEATEDEPNAADAAGEPATEESPTVGAWLRLPQAGDPIYAADRLVPLVVVVDPSARGRTLPLTVEAALFECELDGGGAVVTTVRYRLSRPAAELQGEPLRIRLPATATDAEVRWDDAPVALPPLQAGRMLRVPPPLQDGPVELLVHYRTGCEVGGLVRVAWAPPELVASVFVRQARWELTTPSSLHLFRSPQALAPGFQWLRRGVGYHRTTTIDTLVSREADWPDLSDPAGRYVFTSTGLPGPLEFTLIARSWLVLLGATITLSFAFLLFKAPVRVQLPLVLLAGFLVAVAAVQYLEPLQVLLQPALLGLALALAAVSIDSWNRHENGAPVLTVPSESEFVQPMGQEAGGLRPTDQRFPLDVSRTSGSTQTIVRTTLPDRPPAVEQSRAGV